MYHSKTVSNSVEVKVTGENLKNEKDTADFLADFSNNKTVSYLSLTKIPANINGILKAIRFHTTLERVSISMLIKNYFSQCYVRYSLY